MPSTLDAPTPSPTLAHWVAGARPRTLPAAVVPVVVGAACAIGSSPRGGVVWWRVAVALCVSLLLQVGVNYANDYSDGIKGTDDVRVGPVRLVAGGLVAAAAVKHAALLALAFAAIAGLTLALATSWWLLGVGAAAILAAWFYTGGPRPYGYIGLGEVFVFVFFGLVATIGTTYVAIEHVPAITWAAASGVGLLVTALLVANNLRDIPTDRVTGKKTLAVRLGDARTRAFYLALLGGALVAALVCAPSRPWSLLALASIVLAVAPVRAVRSGAKGRDLIAVLGATGRLQLAYGALLAVGLALS